MVNRLETSTSPYLLQHATNPVDWWPWCDEAFAEAAKRDVPVLLSVGYAACHWCHVMAHESFEDEDIARVMNANFVNIKVDREERPDVDSVYMEATVAMTGHGGWPMTCFLTPTGEPFHCGTYYPPSTRHGLPGFPQLLVAVRQAWANRSDEVREAAKRVVGQLTERAAPLAEFAVDDITSGPARSRRCPWCRKRVTRWPAVGCTTSLRVGSPVTASTPPGWCHISRRCSMTTRYCCASTPI
jgi:uncharacterized protein YyaL (SSP411 family)